MSDGQEGLFAHPKGEQVALPDGGGDRDGERAEQGSPLDVAQTFLAATSYQVRGELEELVRRDLLGPWGGEDEELPAGSPGPRERYLVGMLGPRPRPKSTVDAAGEVPDTETGVGGDADAELPDVLTPQSLGRVWASSMGMAFAVPSDVDTLAVTARWGRYQRRAPEPGRSGPSVWAREPVSHEVEVRLDGPPTYRIPFDGDDPDAPGVVLAVAVRGRPGGGRRVVEVTLVNARDEPSRAPEPAWLFQPALTVTASDGHAAVFLPVDDPTDGDADTDTDSGTDDPTAAGEDLEDVHLRLLYRDVLRYATGRNVAVRATVAAGQRRAYRLDTDWMPAHDVPATVAPTGYGTGLTGVELSMDALADTEPGRLAAGLAPLADGYLSWLDDREAEIGGLPEALRPAAQAAVFTARRAAARIRAGIDLLTDATGRRHREALAAFRFANRAMALQRRHTTLVRLREEHGLGLAEAQAEVDAMGAAVASWRPFQLAFVLLNLPALTDPAHPERATDHTATVDLLFFPTGGGKTEAYLGLTAYTFAIRRLQGTVGVGEDARSGAAGVAVLMRYTLRLLTAQQFQRAAALVCAAEVLRRGDEATWGAEPFRIGLWVGAGVSPNWFDDAAEQVAQAREAGSGRYANVLQTLTCPWCGTPLAAQRDLTVVEETRRVLLHCPNGEGAAACPFSRRVSPDGLPILTVDEEIYRYCPSLVVATVDKLAQLPWRGYAGMLFGRVRRRCPRHGYRHDDLDARTGCGTRHNRKGNLPAVASEPVTRLRPPDLVVQDELHLISGALGTTVGLFEAAVDELCTWRVPSGVDTSETVGTAETVETRPKVVASTATTRRAREQVLGVFGRDLAVFPPQVLDVADTFFSRQVPVTERTPGRRYLGVCAHGMRLKSAEIRLAEILLLAGQWLFDRYGEAADPYLTLVGYFNATRELAGMRRYLDDDVATRVRLHGPSKGLANRIVTRSGMLVVQELTSRISSADISEVLRRLEYTFDPDLDTSRRRLDCPTELARAAKERRTPHPLARRYADRMAADRQPVDVVLATSMLQVGVDVSRFGLMVVTGQPKNTAEYIQASSRVGRDQARPGLVVTLYNWSRPRDLAHYEDFAHYHATFYRQVEALSVTPYTRRALDRGTAATLVAAVRNAEEVHSRNADAHDVPLDGPVVRRIVARLLARAETVHGERGRGYLEERVKVVLDRWRQKRTGSVRLGYSAQSTAQQNLVGLLRPAGEGRWDDLTVGMSMRETEHEVNLLLPGGGEIFTPPYGSPEWTFGGGAAGTEGGTDGAGGGDGADGADGDALPGDEMGDRPGRGA